MKKREFEIKDSTILIILLLVFWGFCILGIIATVKGHPDGILYFFSEFRVGELVIGLGTVLLAIFTAYLAFSERDENIKNRELTRIVAAKERRRLRIKEQLEGLYSPAMAWIDNFNITDEHFTNSEKNKEFSKPDEPKSGVWIFIQDARSQYQFLAEPPLKEKLIEYYEAREDPPYNKAYDQFYEKELEFRGLLTEIQAMIKSDYKKLSDEYSELVNVK
jgi:hypothetical protein